ncbi:MAG: cytochrome c [Planctomycetota bacterium]
MTRSIALLAVALLAACSESSAPQAAAIDDIHPSELLAQGEALYTQHCLACHMVNGDGVPGMQPALTGWASNTGSADAMVELTVRGIGLSAETMLPPSGDYSAEMPAFAYLSDTEIAAILSYVRTSWGNNTGLVPPSAVRAARPSADSFGE